MTVVAGLFRKYEVRKTDGSAVDPNAAYFVMRLDTDPHARRAAGAYADSIAEENPELAADLLEILRNKPLKGRGPRTLVARALTARDVRILAKAARLFIRHIGDCKAPQEKLEATWAFTRNVEGIVSQVICYRCGGRGTVLADEVDRVCLECDGTGIA